MDQPDKVVNPLLVLSSTGKVFFSLSTFAPENLVSQEGFDCPALRQPRSFSTPGPNLVLIQAISPAFRDCVNLHCQPPPRKSLLIV